MNDVFDQINGVYSLLNVPAVTNTLSGAIYRTTRPKSSKLEDIVIGSLAMANGSYQLGVVNVHVYVPDIESKTKSGTAKIANTLRLETLSKIIVPILKDAYDDDDEFNLYVTNIKMIPALEIEQHFIEIRVETRFYDF